MLSLRACVGRCPMRISFAAAGLGDTATASFLARLRRVSEPSSRVVSRSRWRCYAECK